MKTGRVIGGAVAAVVVIVGAAFGFRAWRHAMEIREAWQQATANPPAAADVPAALLPRLQSAQAKAAARDVAALGELAQLYHANGQLPQAERAYRGLLQFDPTNPRWPHLLAALISGYGRLDEAVPLMQRAVDLAPTYVAARLRLGDAMLKSNRLEEARTQYQEILRQSADNPYALLGLARIDLAEQRLTAAREKLTRAARTDVRFFGAESLLASVFEQLGDDDAAAAARARANQAGRFRVAPDPWLDSLTDECFDVYRLQVAAATEKSTGAVADAIPLLERALKLQPEDISTLRQLGGCYESQGDLGRARELLEKAVASAPDNPGVYLDLSGVYRATNDVNAAIRTLQAGLARCTDTAGLHGELGLTYRGIGRLDDALGQFRDAVRLGPEKPEAVRDLVMTLLEMGRTADAAVAMQAGLKRHPDFPPLLVLGARYEINRHRAEEAAALINRAEHAGGSPGDLAQLASAYRREFGRDP